MGVASAAYRHGRYSKAMPDGLRARYEELLQDEELLSLHDAIALMNGLISDTLGDMSRKEGGALWLELKETFTLFEGEWGAGHKADTAAMALYLRKMKRIIGEGAKDYAARRELMDQTSVLSKLVDKEGKRREREKQMVTTSEAFGFAKALFQAVVENVSDRATLIKIQSRFLALTAREASLRLDAGRDS